jgi:hypothetical protein
MAKTLYLRRPLENTSDLINWAKAQGFATVQTPDQLHATIIYSKTLMDRWPDPHTDQIVVRNKFDRAVEPLGDGGAVVLKFNSPTMQSRWKEVQDLGAKSDYPTFTPHVTITWDGSSADLSKIKPYDGPLVFGPEAMREIDDDWKSKITEKNKMDCKVIKVDDELGIVFGWGIVSTIDGQPYFDVQDDYIPDDAMLKATSEFMESIRVGKDMHRGDQVGVVVHSMPLTKEVAQAFGISCDRTGWMVGYKPYGKALLDKFRSGEYTGFSIGGNRGHEENVD